MVSLFLFLGCNLSYIFDLFAALHELASASARTSSMRALLKPYGDILSTGVFFPAIIPIILNERALEPTFDAAGQ